jgi:hypothetical protein
MSDSDSNPDPVLRTAPVARPAPDDPLTDDEYIDDSERSAVFPPVGPGVS